MGNHDPSETYSLWSEFLSLSNAILPEPRRIYLFHLDSSFSLYFIPILVNPLNPWIYIWTLPESLTVSDPSRHHRPLKRRTTHPFPKEIFLDQALPIVSPLPGLPKHLFSNLFLSSPSVYYMEGIMHLWWLKQDSPTRVQGPWDEETSCVCLGASDSSHNKLAYLNR